MEYLFLKFNEKCTNKLLVITKFSFVIIDLVWMPTTKCDLWIKIFYIVSNREQLILHFNDFFDTFSCKLQFTDKSWQEYKKIVVELIDPTSYSGSKKK